MPFFLETVLGNVLWVLLILACLLADAPYRAWKLVRNNRFWRGTGRKMWLADRYIQIWLTPRATNSSNSNFELRFTTPTHDLSTPKAQIDTILEKQFLVIRENELVRPNRSF